MQNTPWDPYSKKGKWDFSGEWLLPGSQNDCLIADEYPICHGHSLFVLFAVRFYNYQRGCRGSATEKERCVSCVHKACFSKTESLDLQADSIERIYSVKGKWQQTLISVSVFRHGAGQGAVCVHASGGGSEGLGPMEQASVTCSGSALLFCLLAFEEG